MKEILRILAVLAVINQTGILLSGQTPAADPVLDWLVLEDTSRVVAYLVNHDINTPVGVPATTLLVHSILYAGAGMTEWLILKGADVNQKVDGASPLMLACSLGNRKKVLSLLGAGAEIEATDGEGNTALFYAACNGNLKTVKLLLKRGALISRRNSTWQTAYDMAVRNSRTKTAQYLRSRQVKSLPDLLDGPYLRWNRRNRIRSFYLVHDSKSRITHRSKATYQARSDPFLFEGFSGDTLEYRISSRKAPPPDEIRSAEKILVMGDVHGAYDSLVLFLQQNGIIDHSLRWCWGKGHLVFVGDIFDRGDKVTEALWLIYRLEDQAAESGGAVHLALGNHEIMVLSGNQNYTSDKYLLMTSRLNIDYSGLFSKRTVLGQWLRSRNAIVKINGSLFVHAGLSPEIMKTGLSLHDINERVRYFLNHPEKDYKKEDFDEELFGSPGPFWYRGYFEENHEYRHIPETELERVLDYFGAERIFVGHTNVSAVTPLYHNRVFAMDVPFYTYGYPIQGVLLEGDSIYLLNSRAERRQIQ